MADIPEFVESFRTEQTVILASHSTTVAVIGWTAGSSGSRIHGISVANTDGGGNTCLLYLAQQMTLQSAMGTGAFLNNGGSSDTITRSSGSFLTDGWTVGDRLVVIPAEGEPLTTLTNGFFTTLTAVVAGTLTFATAVTQAAENFPTGAIMYRLSQLHLTTLVINAGNAASTDALDMLITDWPIADATPDRYITIGPNDGLVFSVGTAVGVSPDRVDIAVFGGDY